ncbi:hypothetical protein L6272_05205 [Microgenomates group bacterium]|nr:hypothetical protein [Microgenomates group bacterium]
MNNETISAETPRLKIIEYCSNLQENYRWQEEAWFDGQPHPIEPVDIIDITRSNEQYEEKYTIETAVFQDETARKGTVTKWYLDQGTASNVVMISSHDFGLRTRAVEGKGWILVYHPQFGVHQIEVGPDLEKNPVVELGYGHVFCFIASSDCKRLVLEGIDMPDFQKEYEVVIEDNESHTPKIVLSDGYAALFSLESVGFWDKFDQFLKRGRYDQSPRIEMDGP